MLDNVYFVISVCGHFLQRTLFLYILVYVINIVLDFRSFALIKRWDVSTCVR